MKQSFYLAIKYLQFHPFRSLVLIASLGLILYLPLGLHLLITKSEEQMMSRADATPLIIGAQGNNTDLVINSLYFEQEELDPLNLEKVNAIDELGFGYSIPMLSMFEARGFPIVGTNLDYLDFRGLEIKDGRSLRYVGECVLGSKVAKELGLAPGDSIISSPKNLFDLAGVYPLKMEVVGVLNQSDSPDDYAVFTDLKTNWIIMGLGHGHEDLQAVTDSTLILKKDSNNIVASPKLYIYNEVDGRNNDSFHFHGDPGVFPITSILFVPDDKKAETIIRGRFESGQLLDQIVVPSQIVEKLLQSIFRIKQVFNTVFVMVGFATLLILGLIVLLTLQLRKDELFTMFTIGSSRFKVAQIVTFELLVLTGLSIIFAFILNLFTSLFVLDFIQKFIL